MNLGDEFDALIAALERDKAPYAVAGALAVAVWGAARATKDIDLLIPAEALTAVQRVAASVGFSLPTRPMTFRDGMTVHRINKVKDNDLLMLDLLVVNDDLTTVWDSRVRV